MESNEPVELTPAERRQLDALPRERLPGRLLEERTVRALKDRGVIRSLPALGRVPTARWLAAAIAAALALFTSGIAVGQWTAARVATDAIAQTGEADAEADATESALHVQRAGSAYVAALTRLVDAADAADERVVAQAREVALAALWAAAGEVVRLAPDDPVAGQILRGFEQARQEEQTGGDRPPVRQVIWF
jgi:hypothetical protein